MIMSFLSVINRLETPVRFIYSTITVATNAFVETSTYHHLLSSPGCDGHTIHRMKDRRKKIKVERPTQSPIVLGVEARK